LQGTSQAHEVGIILSIWKDKLAWLLNRNKPTAA